MADELQRARLHAQRYEALAQRIRGKLWTDHGSERLARHRGEWPELWEAIDALVAQVNKDIPPYGSGRGLFERD